MVQVVAALIWRDNRFMICQRPEYKARGLLWEFVGGKVEPGETKAQALARECREELDVQVEVGTVFCEVDHVYPDLTIHLTLLNAAITRGEPTLLEHNAIAWITPEEIDRVNILNATKNAMAMAAKDAPCDLFLVDAITRLDVPGEVRGLVHGDALCYSIAAASILAKVTRDRIMRELDARYPQYGLAKNKGYGTAEHIAALRQYGPTPIHRRSFIGHFVEV